MPPTKWDDEGSDSDTPPSSPPPVARKGKFDDEEEDSDLADDWEAADSDVEKEKAKKAKEAAEKAEAEKKAAQKSAAQRRKEHIERRKAEKEAGDDSSEEEDEAERRSRLKREEIESDLKHAVDLFGSAGAGPTKRSNKAVNVVDPNDPANTIDLSTLSIFNATTKDQFAKLRETLVPLFTANEKKAHYALFLQEFTKAVAQGLPSDQIKKLASGLTTLSNEKMKEEKTAEKGAKKSKAAKTKVTLNAARDISYRADTANYDDGLDEDDFM